MRPPPLAAMGFATAWIMFATPSTLMSMTLRQLSSLAMRAGSACAMKRSGVLIPAVWMSAKGTPCFSTSSSAAATLIVSATSQTTGVMLFDSAAVS